MGLRKKKKSEPEPEAAPTPTIEELEARKAEVEAELSAVDEEFESTKAEYERIQNNAAADSDFVRDDMARLYKEKIENKEAYKKFMENVFKHKISDDTLRKQTLAKLTGVLQVIGKKRRGLMVEADRLRKQISLLENEANGKAFLKTLHDLLDHFRAVNTLWEKLKKQRLTLDIGFMQDYLQKSSDPWARYHLTIITSKLKTQVLPTLGLTDFIRSLMMLTLHSPTKKPLIDPDYTEINRHQGRHLSEQGIVTGNRYNIESR